MTDPKSEPLGEAERLAMQRALAIAATSGVPLGPNPRVGCVILSADGAVIAEGFHRGAGHPHAEVEALLNATASTTGATAVVTLEPCNHTGRTGPCAQALIEAGVSRVVYALSDPNPEAAGGAETLRQAGIEVIGDAAIAPARELNRTWLFALEHQRPYVTWKYAATLDGRSAAVDGTSQWISNEQSRADVHRLRATCDAIVVGTGTVLADDPHLTARDAVGACLPRDRQPLRVVVGRRPVPDSAKILDAAAETLVVANRDPHVVLHKVYDAGRRHVLLEGGPTVAAAFLAAGLVDEIVAYLAPTLLGAGPTAVSDLGIATLTDAIHADLTHVERLGNNIKVVMELCTAQRQEGVG